MTTKNLIVDVNNLAFITRWAKIKTPASIRRKERMVTEMIFREMLNLTIWQSHTNKATGILVAGEGGKVWRKDIYPEYKGGDTKDEDIYYNETLRAADLFKNFMREYTAAYVIEVKRTEADDVIGVWCQESEGVTNIICSTDTDYAQLHNERTHIWSPVQKVWRAPEDPAFELFVKCIRGDKNDNVRSAFPRVRKTLLEEAWVDDYKLLNLFETVNKDGTKVGDRFDLNRQLIDLEMQPLDLREKILDTINNYIPAKFSELGVRKVLSDMGLKSSIDMFKYKDKAFKTPPIFKQER